MRQKNISLGYISFTFVYTKAIVFICKIVFRWLTSFNIKPASNVKQRIVAGKWTYSGFSVEDAPLQFEIKEKKGRYEIRLAAWGYIDNLPEFIFGLLDTLEW